MRQVLHYITGAVLVFGAYFLGTFIAQRADMSIPGALIGLLILLSVLLFFPALERHLTQFAASPLKHMSLLFVPAVLGISLYWGDIINNALAIFIAIVLTTAISLGITAWCSQWLLNKKTNTDD
ncbi:CidA/LrgA family protein [Alteromonas gracilis]|uniref:CidA/LrgA family protein n=1 Tax=Alteromonas gracilis TaxID=1479524 RepID=UPI0030CBE239